MVLPTEMILLAAEKDFWASVSSGMTVLMLVFDASMQVALAKFGNSQGLRREGGGAYFNYDVVAGRIFTGTAGNTQGGTIGAHNVISPQSVENSNTSINTVMPELTLAQKSFSAASKIISVGNTMIDDVNGLIR
jgi:flagellar hook protein FlgE